MPFRFVVLLALVWGLLIVTGACASEGLASKAAGESSAGVFVDRVLVDGDGHHKYVVFVPPGYRPSKRWPVILFLHGAGERGRDGRQQLDVGLGPIVRLRPQDFPAIIVFPQAEELDERILTAWSEDNRDGARALRMLSEVERDYSTDPTRRVLAGWSMGGYGVWHLASSQPAGFWSSALSVSGGATADTARRIPRELPFWAIHGEEDRIVRPSQMSGAVEAARSAGAKVESITIAGQGHDVWRVAFGRDEVTRWMLNPRSVETQQVDWSEKAVEQIAARNVIPEPPFRASTVIHRAVALRIGNDAFRELAKGVPAAIPPERLRGKAADLERTFQFGGTTIRAAIRDVGWSAKLAGVSVCAATAERLEIDVALSDLVLHAGRGTLTGGSYHAECGPFDVVLGRRRPVVVEVSTRPRAIDGRVQLTEREIRFTIPDDNWFVTEPEWATAKGPDLTPELVKVGVVGGIYRSKENVEKAVRELIPPLVSRIEERLVQAPPRSVATMLWPLPTSPPRIRLLADGVRTDSGGVSVTIGLAVEGPASSLGDSEIIREPIAEGDSGGIQIGIAPDAMSAVARSISADASARLDVRDLADSPLARLGDRSLLIEAAPSLANVGPDVELRTVLSLAEPFEIELADGAARATDELQLVLRAPSLMLEIGRRARPGGRWEVCAEYRLSLAQAIDISLSHRTDGGRIMQTSWRSEPEITGELSMMNGGDDQGSAPRSDVLVNAFAQAWKEWTAEAAVESTVEDIAIGGARLGLDGIPVRGERVWLEFERRR
jgi:predicted esterase